VTPKSAAAGSDKVMTRPGSARSSPSVICPATAD
jgi:hypothetical protein